MLALLPCFLSFCHVFLAGKPVLETPRLKIDLSFYFIFGRELTVPSLRHFKLQHPLCCSVYFFILNLSEWPNTDVLPLVVLPAYIARQILALVPVSWTLVEFWTLLASVILVLFNKSLNVELPGAFSLFAHTLLTFSDLHVVKHWLLSQHLML